MNANLISMLVIFPVTAILSGWYVYAGFFGGMCGDATAARARRVQPAAFLLFLVFTGIMAGAWNNILLLLGAPFSTWSFFSQEAWPETSYKQQLLLIILPRVIDMIWFIVAIVLVSLRRQALREWLAEWGCPLSGWRWWVLLGTLASLLQGFFSLGNLLGQMLIQQIIPWDVTTTIVTIVTWQVIVNLLVAGVLVVLYRWLFRK